MVSDVTADTEAKLLPTLLSLVQPLHLEATPALQQAVTSTSAANGHTTPSAAPNVAAPCYVSSLRRRRLASGTSSASPRKPILAIAPERQTGPGCARQSAAAIHECNGFNAVDAFAGGVKDNAPVARRHGVLRPLRLLETC